jgi:hypothetical protein
MNRARLGSLLGLLSSILFAASLLIAPRLYPSYLPAYLARALWLWSLCGVLFIASAGLWFQRRWARVVFLVGGSIFLLDYARAFLLPVLCVGTCALKIPSDPMYSVFRYYALTCSTDSVRCYQSLGWLLWLQPALMLLTMVTLLKPLASNNRWLDGARHYFGEHRSALLWLGIPLATLVLIVWFGAWGALLLVLYPLQVVRLALRGAPNNRWRGP